LALLRAGALIEGKGGALKYDSPFLSLTWTIIGAVRVAMSGSAGFARVLFFLIEKNKRRGSEKLGLVAWLHDFDWATAHFVYGEGERGAELPGIVVSLVAYAWRSGP
jgi:hypothetical protein